MLLGDIIKQYREEHQMSLQDFAELVHTSRSYIHMLEKNYNPATGKPISPSIETLKSIAQAMKIDIEDLLKQLNSDQNIYLDELEYHKQFADEGLNTMMEKCGKRLKECRIKNNLSISYISKKTDIPVNKIERWEDGITSDINNKVLKVLSDLYKVDPVWLMGLDVPAEREIVNSNIQGMNKKSESSAVVLIYGTIPAGIPMECIEDIIDTEEIPTDMLRGGKEFFGLKIKGDSMEPDYLDGDIIILQKQDDCESGDDCVVMVNGNEGTFKRVFKNENGIILQPLNNKYQPMPYSNEQIETLPVKILGVFEELRRKKKKK